MLPVSTITMNDLSRLMSMKVPSLSLPRFSQAARRIATRTTAASGKKEAVLLQSLEKTNF